MNLKKSDLKHLNFASPTTASTKQLGFTDISFEGRLGLLEMAFSRVRFGFGAMVVVGIPFTVWCVELKQGGSGLAAWTLFYLLGLPIVSWLFQRFQRERKKHSAEDVLVRWTPRVHVLAVLYGSSLVVPPILTTSHASFEFQLLYLATVAAIVAGNSVQSSPMLTVFRCIFFTGWGGVALMVPFTFPENWHYVFPLTLVYVPTMLRHSSISHRFFVQNTLLQEQGIRLAEGFRKAKDDALQALHDKNMFLTTASHDLRQPVHAMGFLVESVLQKNRDSSLKGPLNDLRQSVRSATQMFNALLDLSRIESGRVTLNVKSVELTEIVQVIATTFREEARSRGLGLRVFLPRIPAVAIADPTLLRQSLCNLMHNALRYTREGGILLAVRRRSDGWKCEVWDTGVGIATTDRQRIFSPFFRGEHAWGVDNAGHGLGLAVVARSCTLMDAKHGFCSIESKGSCFWIQLRGSSQLPTSETGELNAPAELNSELRWCGSCLVVDDDPLVRTAWKELMLSWGVSVNIVESGADAMKLLESGARPDVVFCDYRLRSGESGFELLRTLLDLLPNARGAMISGELEAAELIDAEELGYIVLSKPVEPSQLKMLFERWSDDYLT